MTLTGKKAAGRGEESHSAAFNPRKSVRWAPKNGPIQRILDFIELCLIVLQGLTNYMVDATMLGLDRCASEAKRQHAAVR